MLLEVGQNIRVDLVVQPGEQTQTITVTGEIPAIDTTDATLGGTVSNQSISELPLNGRNFERLLDLRPGNVSTPGAGTGSSSTNGRRIRTTTSARGRHRRTSPTPPAHDLECLLPWRRFQFSVAHRRHSGIQFRAKSQGGIRLQGRLGDQRWDQVGHQQHSRHGIRVWARCQATDAANFFTGAVTPANLEQFGATAGGPIIKDKLFWFASFEGVRDVTREHGHHAGAHRHRGRPGDLANCAPTSAAPCLSMVDACMATVTAGKTINPLSAQLAGSELSQSGYQLCVAQPAALSPLRRSRTSFRSITPTSTTFSAERAHESAAQQRHLQGRLRHRPHHHVSGLFYISKSVSQNLGSTELLPQYWTGGINNGQQYSGRLDLDSEFHIGE